MLSNKLSYSTAPPYETNTNNAFSFNHVINNNLTNLQNSHSIGVIISIMDRQRAYTEKWTIDTCKQKRLENRQIGYFII